MQALCIHPKHVPALDVHAIPLEPFDFIIGFSFHLVIHKKSINIPCLPGIIRKMICEGIHIPRKLMQFGSSNRFPRAL